MPSEEALAKLRAVLDYVPEEAARLLPGDDQAYYDALTHRLHRTVAVKSMVRRRVMVTLPDLAPGIEPEGVTWTPPAPIAEPAWSAEATSVVEAPGGAWSPPPPAADMPEEPPAEDLWTPGSAESVTVVEAVGDGPDAEPEAPVAGGMDDDDFFDVRREGEGPMDLRVVEPEVSLSESEWSNLERSSDLPEEEALAPREAGAELAPMDAPADADDGEAFEEVRLDGAPAPTTRLRPVPGEVGIPEAEPLAEFEIEEEGEIPAPEEFEVLEAADLPDEGGEAPYQVNEYTLFRRDQLTKSGRRRSSFFFSTEPSVEGAVASPLPDDHEVIVQRDTGVPVIRKSAARVLPIIEIEGIGPVMAERLDQAGLRTTKDLLHADLRVVGDETGISERLLGNFRAMADLLQLSGLYPDQAAALVYAGCRSLADLNKASPVELAKQVNQAAKDHNLKLRGKMAPARIKAWQSKINNLELVK